MANKMLIDAAHPEETRVVVSRGKRVDEFDYESALRKQLRGNIYLAKVTRVESSLQAAFVDYGGNRHGFLAFSEIHPDYYQIPVADRQALLEEELEAASFYDEDDNDEVFDEEDEDAESKVDGASAEKEAIKEVQLIEDNTDQNADQNKVIAYEKKADDATLTFDPDTDHTEASTEAESLETSNLETQNSDIDRPIGTPSAETALDTHAALDHQDKNGTVEAPENPENLESETQDKDHKTSKALDPTDVDDEDVEASEEELGIESVGSEDALEEVPARKRRRRRAYKIQEVIRRRQVILVQVVKEERGTKGAALTTYLSLAGRYTVLMPNTARGGGISRKITNPADRKRLRKIANELEVPAGTGLIIRTAGASRTKAEIKRDYEYLLRLWENVRDLTLQSKAPCLVYEEGSLIKRSIRDLYSREIDEVLVAGDEAYKEAKNFMRMIMPSHAKNVQPYKDAEPLFVKYQIEQQLNELYSPYVTLNSGGYIVINQTEALVAIDVNSGRATHEHNIEDTALRTNLEAAEEIARQLRLRDLAGLIVIDFIDMEERRNNRAVERKTKECLRNDRARIQVGRISHFGLLEMSRQRLRTGVLEGTTSQCPHCQGTGIIRSTDSVALSVLRSLEDTLLTSEKTDLTATTSVDVALYILNQKRLYVKDIEARYNVSITVIADQKTQGGNFLIEHDNPDASVSQDSNTVVKMDWGYQPPEETEAKPHEDGKKRRRRRRRRKSDRYENEVDNTQYADEMTDETMRDGSGISGTGKNNDGQRDSADISAESQDFDAAKDTREQDDTRRGRRRSRRRGQRGGRRHRTDTQQNSEQLAQDRDTFSQNMQDQMLSGTQAIALQGDLETAENHADQDANAETSRADNTSQDDRSTEKRGRRSANGRRRTGRRRGNRYKEQDDKFFDSNSDVVASSDSNTTQMELSPGAEDNVSTSHAQSHIKSDTQTNAQSENEKSTEMSEAKPKRSRRTRAASNIKNTESAKQADAPPQGTTQSEQIVSPPVNTATNGSSHYSDNAPSVKSKSVEAKEDKISPPVEIAEQEVKPARKGWWQKRPETNQ